MRNRKIVTGEKDKGGGGLTAALLYVTAFVALFAATAYLTALYLAPRDTLSRFAPSRSAIYVHAGRDASRGAAFELIAKGLHPDEAAAFAVPTGEGSFLWGRLLTWQWPHRPSDEERTTLKSLGAVSVEAGTWLIGGPELLRQDEATGGTGTISDPAAGRALSFMRQLFAWQAYVNPSAIPDKKLLGGAAQLRQLQPFVAGFSEDGKSALAAPIGSPTLTALAALPRTTSTNPLTVDASLSIQGARLPFSFSNVLLDKLLEPPENGGANGTRGLADARQSLDELLAEPYEISVSENKLSEQPDFVARYSGLDAEKIKKALLNYAGAIKPTSRVIGLPDGSNAIEYWINPDSFSFVEVGSDKRLNQLVDDGGNAKKLFVWVDGTDVAIASSASLLMPEPTYALPGVCASLPGPVMTIDAAMFRKLVEFLSVRPRFWQLLPTSGVFIQLDGGLLAFCG